MTEVTRNKKIMGFLAMSLIWGTTWLVIKIGLEGVPPFLGVGIRFLFAGIILILIGTFKNHGFTISFELLKISAVIGILLFTISYSAVYWAEQYISSGLASVLFTTMPLFVALFAGIFLKNENLTPLRLMGMIIGIGGTVLIFSENIRIDGVVPSKGLIVMILSPISAALSIVITKKHIHSFNPFFLNGTSMIIGGLATLLIHFSFDSSAAVIWNVTSVSALLYLSIFGSALAFGIYYWMLQHIQVTTVSMVVIVSPVIAVFLGAAVLSESLSRLQLIGSVFVLGGVVLSEVVNYRKKQAA
ncbi:MAG: EamA family transporter [Candidatus Marinimicrobia bacterium]|nr:EamA family transporter [Candidatus Neomarinimicrobiota bacterium]